MRFFAVSNGIDLRGNTIERVEKLGVRLQWECLHNRIGLNDLSLAFLGGDGQPFIGYLLIFNLGHHRHPLSSQPPQAACAQCPLPSQRTIRGSRY
jgi:hypothetical protein